MKIQAQQNNINFKSIPLHPVNIRNSENGLVKAVFSELRASSKEDKLAVIRVRNSWEPTSFVKTFYEHFFDMFSKYRRFHAIELPVEDHLGTRIIGLVESNFEGDKKLYISRIFTNPAIKAQVENRKFKNVGEVLLGSMINFAEETQSRRLELSSSNDGFYHRTFKDANIKPNEIKEKFSTEFSLKNKDFKKYIEYCQNKFKFHFSDEV